MTEAQLAWEQTNTGKSRDNTRNISGHIHNCGTYRVRPEGAFSLNVPLSCQLGGMFQHLQCLSLASFWERPSEGKEEAVAGEGGSILVAEGLLTRGPNAPSEVILLGLFLRCLCSPLAPHLKSRHCTNTPAPDIRFLLTKILIF